jgi:uncharacterized protein GlcG (DUF336 family)
MTARPPNLALVSAWRDGLPDDVPAAVAAQIAAAARRVAAGEAVSMVQTYIAADGRRVRLVVMDEATLSTSRLARDRPPDPAASS